ncbi:hypothetical protein NDU88_002865 [Pleurodeles waltl]|uniref:Secreted protein n=1 Tax=Pleurodeles waltl TaxID=8319 RepID=A0AAV7VCE7_PLEWA|nr:hypothetical protein NDU88_002865 [Pleurodeles waltl]
MLALAASLLSKQEKQRTRCLWVKWYYLIITQQPKLFLTEALARPSSKRRKTVDYTTILDATSAAATVHLSRTMTPEFE